MSTIRFYSLNFFVLLLTCYSHVVSALPNKTIVIGVQSEYREHTPIDHWMPLSDYLTKILNDTSFEFRLLAKEELVTQWRQHELDFVLSDPTRFLQITQSDSLSRVVATVTDSYKDRPVIAKGGTIIALKERDDLQSLSDLKEKTIGVDNERHLGSLYLPLHILYENNINENEFTLELYEEASNDSVIKSVLLKDIDVGFLAGGELERLSDMGYIGLDKLKVINQQNLAGYPFAVSTRLYSNDVLVMASHVRQEVGARLTAVLLSIPPNHSTLHPLEIYGFRVADNYAEVERLMRELRVRPFDIRPDITLDDLWQRYSNWIISVTLTLVIVGILLIQLFATNQQLRRERRLKNRSEQALRESNNRFTLSMQATNDGIWDWDLTTNAVYFSPRWKSMLGYEDSELTNAFSTWEELIDEDGKQRTTAQIEDCINGKQDGFVVEFRMKHKDGHWVDILSRSIIVRDTDGNPLRMVGTHVDISQQKSLEQRLRDSEAQSKMIIDTSPDAILLVDLNGIIVRINPKTEILFGYTEVQLLGQPIEILIPERFHKDHKQVLSRFLSSPKYIEFERGKTIPTLLAATKQGLEFPCEIGLSPISLNGEVHIVTTLRDITARKRAEESLRFSERSLAEAQKIAHLGNWWFNLETSETYWSDEVYRILGYREKEFSPDYKTLRARIHPEDNHALELAEKHSLETGEAYSIDYRIILPNETIRWVHMETIPSKGTEGSIDFLRGTLQDITASKSASDALAQRAQEQTALLEVGREIASTLNLSEVLQIVAERITDLTLMSTTAVYLLENNTLELVATQPPLPPDFPDVMRYAPLSDHPHILHAVESKQVAILPDARKSELSPAERIAVEMRNLRSIVYLPLNVGNEVVGVMIAATVGDTLLEGDEAKNVCGTYANMSALAIANARLYNSSRHYADQLEQQYAFTRAILDNAPMGMHIYQLEENDHLVFTSSNPAADRILQTDSKHLIGKSYEELYPPLVKTEIPRRYREIARHGGEYVNNQVTYSDENYRGTFDIKAFQTVPGQMAVFFEDVTEAQAQELALRQSEQKLRTILDSVDAFIYLKDTEGRYLFANRMVRAIWQAEMDEIIGFRDDKFFDAETSKKIRENDIRVLVNGETLRTEETNTITETGKTKTFLSVKLPLRQEDGSIYALCGISTDITDRIQAEAELERHRNQLQNLVNEQTAMVRQQANIIDQTHDSILTTNLDGIITSWNKGSTTLFGYTADNAKDKHIHLITTPESDLHFNFEKTVQKLKSTGQWETETYMKHANGRQFPAHLSLSLLYDDQGEPSGLIAYTMDITERKTMEESLREKEADLSRAQTVGRMGSWRVDLKSQKIFWSEETYRIFGVPSDIPVDFEFFGTCIYPDDRNYVFQCWENALDGAPYDLEHRILANGEIRWLHEQAEFLYDDRKNLIAALGVSQDITERKAAETDLRAAEERYRLLFSESRDAILTLAPPTWKFTSGNAAARDLFYLNDETNFVNIGPWDLSPPTQPNGISSDEKAREMILKAMQEGSNFFEWQHRRHNGKEFPATVLLTRVETSGEVFLQATVRDVSEEKAAEQVLRAANLEAERLARAKSEFLANMSHEIRTPLNAVIGLSKIGMRKNANCNGAESYFEQILNSGQHLLGVINDVLDYSKIEAGKLSIHKQACKLVSVISSTTEIVETIASAKGLKFYTDVPADIVEWVEGDSQRIRQILVNLLSNAIKFTEVGEVRLRVVRVGSNTRFDVSDTGIGMTEEQQARLFHPFEQADSSSTREFGGTGLGLVISQRLAQAMGGDIEVKSVVNEGSTFSLTLPLKQVNSPTLEEKKTVAEVGKLLQGINILAAEDVAVNRLILEDILNQQGATVTFAENGQQVLDCVSENGQNAFNLVLMDVQMPIMDGLEASRKLKQLAPHLPIIGLTAHALMEEKNKCLDAGMVDHITKPIDEDLLYEHILKYANQALKPVAINSPERLEKELDIDKIINNSSDKPTPADQYIDWKALAIRFKRSSFIERMFKVTIKEYSDTPDEILRLVKSEKRSELGIIAHKLKSVFGNLEAKQLSELALETENITRADNANSIEISKLGTKLADQLKAFIHELKLFGLT